MPNVNEILEIADGLAKKHVRVIPDSCVAVRNRNATCRRCVNSCPVGAIEVSANELHLDSASCTGCGACVTSCPTEALGLLDADLVGVAGAAAEASQGNGGLAVVACARMAAKHLVDPSRFVEVPCMASVHAAMLVEMAALGVREVLLVDGTCQTCKYGATEELAERMVDEARSLLACQGCETTVSKASSFPEEMLASDTAGLFGATRRGFFREAVSAAKDTASVAARTTIEQRTGMRREEPALGLRLRVSGDGRLPRVDTPRHDGLINALDEVGPSVEPTLKSSSFAAVSIDAAACNACGMCSMFCPTDALRRVFVEGSSREFTHMEFHASECVNCRACRDVCWKGALQLENEVSTDQLFDFEPVVFAVSNAGNSNSFGKAFQS